MAQHEPVPIWPKMSQHSLKWPKISPIWSQLLPNKANTNHKIPLKWLNKGKRKPQNTTKWPNMSPIWCRHSPQWPNISPRSGKHSLTAACPKKETKKHSSKNHQQRSPQIVFFLGILGCFVQTPCMDDFFFLRRTFSGSAPGSAHAVPRFGEALPRA